MGTAELRGHFGAKRHDLIVTTFQMCILMLFNKKEVLSLEDFAELQIPEAELKRHLISLCTPKHRILKKSSKGPPIYHIPIYGLTRPQARASRTMTISLSTSSTPVK